ncbi:uncharacterized protein FA14DRAFT_152989 [Meira miltonrushii]|uniref:Uncharacterized protein n=1 Tax=Meira miltonrushii TaxID=1280837 RepID=A0A316VND7_9BASI|nr:uncharacterized protein FA14DRAFT_152989 [Meira miltonrushii]PWN37621.1 hypothetical protein FA14DRAFT_152989 [Meira miltonrushii]
MNIESKFHTIPYFFVLLQFICAFLVNSASLRNSFIRRSGIESNGYDFKFLEKQLMYDSDDSNIHSSQQLQRHIDSYQSIIDSHIKAGQTTAPKDSTEGAILALRVPQQKKVKKSTSRDMKRNREWRDENRDRINAGRRKMYGDSASAAGRKYAPQGKRVKNSTQMKPKIKPIPKEPGYYTEAKRQERRMKKTMKKGMTMEMAREEAIMHLKSLKLKRVGKL